MTSAKLFLLGIERDLLWVDTNYYRHVARDGSPSSNLEGGLLRLSFVSQESDEVFGIIWSKKSIRKQREWKKEKYIFIAREMKIVQ